MIDVTNMPYLICLKCERRIEEISRDPRTPAEMRYHVSCRPWPPYSTRARRDDERKKTFFDSKRREREEDRHE